jgi:branched-chain amino acid transport system substrate-binding protein
MRNVVQWHCVPVTGSVWPPEIKLQPNKVYFRPGDHQLMSSEFPGEILPDGVYPKVFKVADVVAGDKIALSVKDTGCKLDYPA